MALLGIEGLDYTNAVIVRVEDPSVSALLERVLEASGRKVTHLPEEVVEIDPALRKWVEGWTPETTNIDDRLDQIAGDFSSCVPEHLATPVPNHLATPTPEHLAMPEVTAVHVSEQPARKKSGPKPKAAAPKPEKEPQQCDHCKEMWVPRRKDMKYCPKPECQKAKKDAGLAAVRMYQRKKYREEKQERADALRPTENEAVQEIEDPKEPLVWTVRDGSRTGEHLTSAELHVALQIGSLAPGTRVEHKKTGLHKVVKQKGQQMLKIQRMYGDAAGD